MASWFHAAPVPLMEGTDARLETKIGYLRISHFCEKARWALDWHGIPYEEISWPPGVHRVWQSAVARRPTLFQFSWTARRSFKEAVPLSIGQRARPRILIEVLTLAELTQLRLKKSNDAPMRSSAFMCAGWHYAEMLPSLPHLVKPALFHRASVCHPLIGNMLWPDTRRS